MSKILGLDLGTNSIGWALIDSKEQKSSKLEAVLSLWMLQRWAIMKKAI